MKTTNMPQHDQHAQHAVGMTVKGYWHTFNEYNTQHRGHMHPLSMPLPGAHSTSLPQLQRCISARQFRPTSPLGLLNAAALNHNYMYQQHNRSSEIRGSLNTLSARPRTLSAGPHQSRA
mmetsp:Transcript_21625/g.47325  ORF Transcript_21625/g.47325 Transcript_21625/m.47325 type:complete len:119 (-) Transcript_21625:960-1316(-)